MKKFPVTAFGVVAAAAVCPAAMAEDAATVDTLLAQGYTVVAAISSQIGPGVFLQKGQSLELCFVAETQSSPSVTTRYCKPVH